MTRDLIRATRKATARSGKGHRFIRRALVAAFVVCGLLSTPLTAITVARKKQIARDQFETAERMREALNGRPANQRKERDYQRVMEAYRKVYYVAPTSSKADAAVVALAELLVEKGRQFRNDATLKDAVGQYEFLRKEYPGSKYRAQALFTIGEIYRDDLNDSASARQTFEEYLKHYPRGQLADDAKQALKEMDEAAAAAQKAKSKSQTVVTKAKDASNNAGKEATPKSTTVDVADTAKSEKQVADVPAVKEVAKDTTDAGRTTKPLVTGVRHWSTPDYTRIAIDLEDEVKFESGRIPNPDRIYFDLKDTKLSSVLKGKSFDVDDGYLKKIRVAQFAPGMTRVVLEVGNDVGEYSAFMLPNPYRLVIDIHGKTPTKLMARTQQPQSSPEVTKPTVPAAEKATEQTASAVTKAEAASKTAEAKVEAKAESKEISKPLTKGKETRAAEVKEAAAKEKAKDQPKSESAKADPKTGPKSVEPKSVEPKTVASSPADQEAGSKTETAQVTKKDIPVKIVEADEPEAVKPEVKKTETVAKASPPDSAIKDNLPVRSRVKKRSTASERNTVRAAQPTIDGDRSLIRALGLKIGRIVVDAGHGGHDTGTIGPNGLLEKDLVLDVALRLGKLLENRLGADVVYTRDDDTFIPLETRTAIANQQQADLFISVHANSSQDPSARGVETYYLNFTSSRDALEVAARENAVSEKSIHELQDLVKKIALKEKIEESREFAIDVQDSLHSGLAAKAPAIRDRGVKKAPFIVLIGANMPSILAEISFISNPTDEKKLETADYRQKIAESLYRGVAKYVGGLSGVKVASKLPKEQGD